MEININQNEIPSMLDVRDQLKLQILINEFFFIGKSETYISDLEKLKNGEIEIVDSQINEISDSEFSISIIQDFIKKLSHYKTSVSIQSCN